ncbi:MAG: (d)CMP kinase [Candidatus Omnitrophica bacterium]|jgi:cytidylate kinase|nr:(d)CMP kinase [Candidatus Omnitrophota bacterium]
MIIAIDGPAGAGKSTVAKILAQKLGFLYIDTGAMYRALTLKTIEQKIDPSDIPAIVDLARHSVIDLINDELGALKVSLDGKDVSSLIREPRITMFVSDIAKIKDVREVMLGLQRKLGKSKDSVLDGRDIGTVVFPDADKKFYLDAKSDERAKRRYKELVGFGQTITLGDVESDLSNRDKIDSTRECAPLRKAEDAVYVDTTDMSIEEVVKTLLGYL